MLVFLEGYTCIYFCHTKELSVNKMHFHYLLSSLSEMKQSREEYTRCSLTTSA